MRGHLIGSLFIAFAFVQPALAEHAGLAGIAALTATASTAAAIAIQANADVEINENNNETTKDLADKQNETILGVAEITNETTKHQARAQAFINETNEVHKTIRTMMQAGLQYSVLADQRAARMADTAVQFASVMRQADATERYNAGLLKLVRDAMYLASDGELTPKAREAALNFASAQAAQLSASQK